MRLQFGTNGTAASGIAPAALETTSGGRKPTAASNAGSSDQISLSSTSSIINRDAVSRSIRIQNLTLAVQAGTYQVASQEIGSRIVSAGLSR